MSACCCLCKTALTRNGDCKKTVITMIIKQTVNYVCITDIHWIPFPSYHLHSCLANMKLGFKVGNDTGHPLTVTVMIFLYKQSRCFTSRPPPVRSTRSNSRKRSCGPVPKYCFPPACHCLKALSDWIGEVTPWKHMRGFRGHEVKKR